MITAPLTYYTTVSDLALCQRCPALLTYKLHYGEKDAWKVGIRGGGFPYGSMFHENIARVFFEAAAHPRNILHAKIAGAVSGGVSRLEALVREDIFMPFVSRYAGGLTAGQLMAMAGGVGVWVRAMAEFFRSIPSLMHYPEGNMHTVFIEPEQKLRGRYDLEGGRLMITGCYDALMFNPDRAEARLFEFKGYRKSDITVPLSQSLIYSWLIERLTGVVPSVEIIYLDENDKAPDVFDSQSVRGMIDAGLPDLFRSAFDVISRRRRPEILRDNNLCSVCRFRGTCRNDYDNAFMRRRRGSSMVSVLVFFMMAVVITAQVYFFTTLSLEDGIEEREILSKRIRLERLIDSADMELRKYSGGDTVYKTYNDTSFYSTTKLENSGNAKFSFDNDMYHVRVHNLNYSFDANKINKSDYMDKDNMNTRIFSAISPDNPYTSNDVRGNKNGGGTITPESKDKIFKKLSDDIRLKIRKYYLIRAYTKTVSGRNLMHQALIRSADAKVIVFSSMDIDNLNIEGIRSVDITGGVSFDKSNNHERLTDMEVWY